ncbi:MAG: hypothetical protein GY723_10105 [bacterium]|nr:hypothetical protein [bacterium]MCP5066763.1 hypothetical protein [bacterium]
MSDVRGATRILILVLFGLTGGAGAETQIDPTRPPIVEAGPNAIGANPSERRLTSIVTRGTQRFAVVDGQTLRVGDRIGGLRVMAIETAAVHVAEPDGEGQQIWALYRTPAVKQASSEENAR